MFLRIDTIHQDGALHFQQPLALPEGAHVRVAIETIPPLATSPTITTTISTANHDRTDTSAWASFSETRIHTSDANPSGPAPSNLE